MPIVLLETYVPATAIVVASSRGRAADLLAALTEVRGLQIEQFVAPYPEPTQWSEILQASEADVIFIDFNDFEAALNLSAVSEQLDRTKPSIAIDAPAAPELILRMMRAGVRELLHAPLTSEAAAEALVNIEPLLRKRHDDAEKRQEIYCFLPAKPGVGASVLAVNTAHVLAANFRRSVLLCDLDLCMGMASFFLKAPAGLSVRDALEHHRHLNDEIWSQLVSDHNGIDLLSAGSLDPGENLDGEALLRVLEFGARKYRAVVVDLSGNLEAHCISLLRKARHIFLVCTHEIPSLHMARVKSELIRNLHLEERTSVLLNRTERRQALSNQEIEKILNLRVRFSFPNDYMRVNDWTMNGGTLDQSSELVQQLRAFAATLTNDVENPVREIAPRRRFLEFFSAAPIFSAAKGGK